MCVTIQHRTRSAGKNQKRVVCAAYRRLRQEFEKADFTTGRSLRHGSSLHAGAASALAVVVQMPPHYSVVITQKGQVLAIFSEQLENQEKPEFRFNRRKESGGQNMRK